jgi:hypothetical protein
MGKIKAQQIFSPILQILQVGSSILYFNTVAQITHSSNYIWDKPEDGLTMDQNVSLQLLL